MHLARVLLSRRRGICALQNIPDHGETKSCTSGRSCRGSQTSGGTAHALVWKWFTGLGFDQEIPHHATFSQNRSEVCPSSDSFNTHAY
ncbi:MAG: transposase [Acidobacteriia bacterium]|nr:transposase [Terriglobia bacterium]